MTRWTADDRLHDGGQPEAGIRRGFPEVEITQPLPRIAAQGAPGLFGPQDQSLTPLNPPAAAPSLIANAAAPVQDATAPESGVAPDGAAGEAQRGKQRDKALVRAAVATLLARLVTTFSVILTLGIAAHSLDNASLGVIAVLTTLTAFLGFGDFGLGTLLMTRLPAARAHGDADGARHIVTLTFGTLAFTGTVIGGAGAVSSFFAPWPTLLGAESLHAADVRHAVLAFFILGGVSIPAAIGGRIYTANLKAAAAQMWLAAGSFLSLVATGVCGAEKLSLPYYVLAISGVPAAAAALQTVWAFVRLFPELRPRPTTFSFREAFSYLKAGLLFAVMSLSAVISYSIDSLVVSSNLNAASAAVFVLASRLFTLVGGTIGLAGQQLWSALSDAIARGDAAWARSRFYKTLQLSVGITGVASVLLVVAGRPIVHLLGKASLMPPMSLLIVLAIYTVYSTTVTQAAYLLAAVEKVGVIASCGVVMAAVNLALSIYLTRRYGLTGPILGSIFALLIVLTAPVLWMLREQIRDLDALIAGRPRAGGSGRHRVSS
ncbi:lipopolysaccharide biosynthesis protein [Jatrophihabitans sp.]|uniref:lipopolysaccharide biosynthesis protein n=1 Tax=Jatrophihabitans sp. TaxID=1932789 RepID=UPI0030C76A88|nr:polysaccharide biosynthesis protein [Jatrophihabitans sp.]